MLSAPLIKYFAVFGLSTTIVILFTPLFIKLAPRLGLMDIPDQRCIHKTATPLAGGIVIFIAFHITCYALYKYYPVDFDGLLDNNWWQAFIIASSILLVVGLIDDRIGMSPVIKLFGQATACASLYFLSGYQANLLSIDFGFFGGLIFVLIWTLSIVNAFNLIDGLDGLCSGLAMISAIGLAAVFIFRSSPWDALICLALIGACAGFLVYNFHPAKVFLGDTGSLFLGFALASISLHAGGKGSFAVILAAPFFIAGIPVTDTLLAIWRRSIRKTLAKRQGLPIIRVMQPDKEHLHHRLLSYGLKQHHVALALYAINILIVFMGLMFLLFSELVTGLFLIIFLISIYLLIKYVLQIELWETHKLMASSDRLPALTRFSILFYIVFDLVWMSFAVWLANFIVLEGETVFHSMGKWFSELPLWELPIFIALFLSNVYIKIWQSCTSRDYLFLAIAVLVGSIISLAMIYPFHIDDTFILLNKMSLFFLFSLLGIIGVRIPHHFIREWSVTHDKTCNVLVYGSGTNGNLYLRECYLKNAHDLGTVNVIGFIDDNLLLRNQYIHGKIVLGGLNELAQLIVDYSIDEIILTTKIDNKDFLKLKEIANNAAVKLIKWQTVAMPIIK
jgi:UDP-N-acetylmuramyl pentapeptide phosphotransferase/UDP-N-acetylglucosamine-1-phosphate transferase